MNSAATADEMAAALLSSALGLSLDGYFQVNEDNRSAIADAVLNSKGTGYADDLAVQKALDLAVADIVAVQPTASPTPTPTPTPSPTPTPTETPNNQPDLIVTDLTWMPANPVGGDEVTFSAVVKNIGGASTSVSANDFALAYLVDDIYNNVVSWSGATVLGPGESTTLKAAGGPLDKATWTAVAGSHSVCAYVDTTHHIAESDEGNNRLTKTIVVSAAVPTYKVTFNSRGGSAVASVTAKQNTTISQPTAPTLRGHTFGGWYREPGCVHAWNFATDKVTANITLYAKWTVNYYTVTFDSRGGSRVASKTVPYNSTITAPVKPTRPGFVFAGWYKEPACTTAWKFSCDKVTGTVTLFAKWISLVPANVTVASASFSLVRVSWGAIPGVTGYEVWRATKSSGVYTRVAVTSAVSAVDNGLATGKTYYYKVRSYTRSGSKVSYSGFSSVVSGVPALGSPAAIRVARVKANTVKITWRAVAGASGYEVWRYSPGSPYSRIASAKDCSCTDVHLKAGTTYTYKVRPYRLVSGIKVYGSFLAEASIKP